MVIFGKFTVDFKSFELTFQVVNGSILDTPETLTVKCDWLIPIGMDNVSGITPDECIKRMRVMLFNYGGRLLGTTQFQSLKQYNEFKAVACQCCPAPPCELIYNNCFLTFDNCFLRYQANGVVQN